MFLFYTYMLMPARVLEQTSVFTLNAPEVAQAYGVGYPYLPILEVVMLGYVLVMWLLRRVTFAVKNLPFAAYVIVSIVCVLFLWARYARGDEPDMWWDGGLAAVRLIAIYGLFVSIPRDARSWGRTIQNALALLFVSSLLLNLAGFANPNTPSNEAGRMNASGLEFTTASYFGYALALSSVTLSTGPRQALLFLCGILGGVMAGGRNALLLFGISLGLLMLNRGRKPLKSAVPVISCVAGAWLALLVAFPSALNRLPIMHRERDNAIYYPNGVAPTDTTLKFFPFLERLSQVDPAMTGRFNAWSTALELLRRRHGVPLASDWYVQQELLPLGLPSHSHNAYLQTLLKFGVLAVPIWIGLLVTTWRGWRAGSPYAVILVFLMASLMVDYWLLVIKATFLLFAIARLNEDWLVALDHHAADRP